MMESALKLAGAAAAAGALYYFFGPKSTPIVKLQLPGTSSFRCPEADSRVNLGLAHGALARGVCRERVQGCRDAAARA